MDFIEINISCSEQVTVKGIKEKATDQVRIFEKLISDKEFVSRMYRVLKTQQKETSTLLYENAKKLITIHQARYMNKK